MTDRPNGFLIAAAVLLIVLGCAVGAASIALFRLNRGQQIGVIASDSTIFASCRWQEQSALVWYSPASQHFGTEIRHSFLMQARRLLLWLPDSSATQCFSATPAVACRYECGRCWVDRVAVVERRSQ